MHGVVLVHSVVALVNREVLVYDVVAQLDGVLLLRSVVAQVDGVNCLCTVSWPIRMVKYLWLGQVKKFHLYFES